MKRTAFLLLATGYTFAVFPQSRPNLDSLKQVLLVQKDDSTKIETLSALCWAYNFYKPDSADFYAQQFYELAIKKIIMIMLYDKKELNIDNQHLILFYHIT